MRIVRSASLWAVLSAACFGLSAQDGEIGSAARDEEHGATYEVAKRNMEAQLKAAAENTADLQGAKLQFSTLEIDPDVLPNLDSFQAFRAYLQAALPALDGKDA